MALRCKEGVVNVLEAAKIRIKNLFATGAKIYLSLSSGKDSLCMADITYKLILNKEIDKKQLVVVFVDEEGLYQSMVEQAMIWYKKFTKIGVKFYWYCLPFKQVSVLDSLSAEESWITWEPGREDCWMRTPPPFAIKYHPLLHYAGEMNYQTFMAEMTSDGINMIGLRTAESIMRVRVVATLKYKEGSHNFYPIYDWQDTDVWRYIKENNLHFPDAYIRLYEDGASRRDMRLCAFFGDGGTRGLIHIAETDHALWERIEKREPNAYLALMYWDSEMMGRKTRKRKMLEEGEEKKDYKAIVKDILFGDTNKYRIGADTRKNLRAWQKMYIKCCDSLSDSNYARIYHALLLGDPKSRVLRVMYTEAGLNRRKKA